MAWRAASALSLPLLILYCLTAGPDVDTVTKQPTDANQLYGLLEELPVFEKNKHGANGNKSLYKNDHKCYLSN